MLKVLDKLEEKLLKLIDNITKPIANSIFNVKRLNVSPLKSGTRQKCPLLALLINAALEVPSRAIRQEIKIKGTHIRKEIKLFVFENGII